MGYATRLSVLVIIAVVRDILRRIAPAPTKLGHPLPQQKDLLRVLPLEVHKQLVEIEAEVGAVPQTVKALLISQSRVVLQPEYILCGKEKMLRLLTLLLVLSQSLIKMYMSCLTQVLLTYMLVPALLT